MDVIDVLSMLKENPDGTFLDFAPFNGKSFGACSITGISPVWEMHPDTDEFFYVIEGEVQITILEEGNKEHYIASAGSSFVVPRGLWHKPGAPNGAKFFYFTPGQSLHSDQEYPEVINA